MKKLSFLLPCFFVSTLTHACGPYFPGSFFNYEENVLFYGEVSIWLDLRDELKLIGDHFYPEWKGKKPVRNKIKTAEAHRLDFAAAAKREGLDVKAEAAAWTRYAEFSTNLLERLQAGEHVDIPKDTGAFSEFYLYTLGRDQFRARPENPEPEAWLRLLVLPPEEQHIPKAGIPIPPKIVFGFSKSKRC